MSKKLLLAAGLLCAYAGITAAEVEMGVDVILQTVRRNNYDVRAARSNYEAVRQGISVAESARLPEVSLSVNLNYLGDGTILDRDFTDAMRDKLPHFGNTITANLYQPVYHGGAITAGIDMARQKAELAAIGMARQLDVSGIEALNAYFNLAKMHNLRRVYAANIDVTGKLIEHMKERYRQGAALKNDITRYELRLSTLKFELQTIDNSISVLNADLVSLLGMDRGDIIIPTLSKQDGSSHTDTVNLTEDHWQTLTTTQSLDLQAVDQSKKLAKTGLKLEKASRLPSIGIVIGDNLTGPITFEIPVLDKNYNYWFAGVSVKYDLSSLWKTNKKERKIRHELMHIDDQRRALSEALSRRVHTAYTAYTQAMQQLDTERLNVRLANENYDVVETRFNNDMALLTDMLDASTAKLDAEVRLVNADINRLLSYYQLKYISGTLNEQTR